VKKVQTRGFTRPIDRQPGEEESPPPKVRVSVVESCQACESKVQVKKPGFEAEEANVRSAGVHTS
jgi:hypothetical protein